MHFSDADIESHRFSKGAKQGLEDGLRQIQEDISAYEKESLNVYDSESTKDAIASNLAYLESLLERLKDSEQEKYFGDVMSAVSRFNDAHLSSRTDPLYTEFKDIKNSARTFLQNTESEIIGDQNAIKNAENLSKYLNESWEKINKRNLEPLPGVVCIKMEFNWLNNKLGSYIDQSMHSNFDLDG